MAGITLPKPVSVAPFVTDPAAPSFSEIWNQEMGNLGTSSDGFDSLFGQMTGMTASIAATADLDPADLQALGDAQAALGTIDAGPLALSLHGAETATDGALNDYQSIATPNAQPTQPVGSGGQPAPTPTPAAPVACNPPADNPAQVLADMTISDAPLQIFVDSYQSPTDPGIKVTKYCGDSAIFQVTHTDTPGGYGSQVGAVTEHSYYFVVSPTKAGTFTGGWQEADAEGNITQSYVTVTIHPKAGPHPQPIGPGPIRRVV